MANNENDLGAQSATEGVSAGSIAPDVAIARHTCEAALRGGSTWNPTYYECGKTAKVEREGAWYCGTHDPVRINAARTKRDAERDREWAERSAKHRIEQAAPEMLEVLKTWTHVGSLQTFESRERFRIVALAAIAKAEGKS